MRNIALVIFIVIILACLQTAVAHDDNSYVSLAKGQDNFPLSDSIYSAPLCVTSQDYDGVMHAVRQLQTDIEKITNAKPNLSVDTIPDIKEIVLIGTIGKNQLIDQLIQEKKLNVDGITGKWETFLIQVIENPFPHVNHALIIAGSDKRGTIYGIYDLSEKIGISPWYWWADVPIEHKNALFVNPGKYTQGPPSVKYRGIFLNDEYPDLTNWIAHKFGKVAQNENPPIPAGVANYNNQFYEKLFELILRLKGNYLWPAMWNNAFNEDDLENPRLADEYGIVMGTSHQEPMLRAQKEWDRRYLRTMGLWNYAQHPDVLQNFWREGIRRNKKYESIITIGLRGEDDTEMIPGGTDAQSMDLLSNIVNAQRSIIAQEVNADLTKVPQLWCPTRKYLLTTTRAFAFQTM